MKKLDMITFRSGYGHLVKSGKATRNGFVSFGELGVLFAKDKPKVNRQQWTYIGKNWDKSVRPYYNA